MGIAPAHSNTTEQPKYLFSLLSREDNFKVFLCAKDGIKFSDSILKETMTRKRYYKALKHLKDNGLIEKYKNNYVHTTFGKFVYQRNIVEVEEYKKYLQEMQMVDSIKRGEFKTTDDKLVIFFEKLMGMRDIHATSKENETASNRIEIVSTYNDMLSLLLYCIELCTSEIMIATRISPEIIINSILHKCKTGVQVKVLADTDLVIEYFKTQGIDNTTTTTADNIQIDYENNKERINVVGNPWYPEKEVERRICKIPFGFILIDEKEVGIEIIDCNEIKKFNMGVLIRDENICKIMKDYFQTLWNNAEADIMKVFSR